MVFEVPHVTVLEFIRVFAVPSTLCTRGIVHQAHKSSRGPGRGDARTISEYSIKDSTCSTELYPYRNVLSI